MDTSPVSLPVNFQRPAWKISTSLSTLQVLAVPAGVGITLHFSATLPNLADVSNSTFPSARCLTTQLEETFPNPCLASTRKSLGVIEARADAKEHVVAFERLHPGLIARLELRRSLVRCSLESRHAGFGLLDDVRQLVSEKAASSRGARAKRAGFEEDVATDRERFGSYRPGQKCRAPVGVQAHVAEIRGKRASHAPKQRARQRFAAARLRGLQRRAELRIRYSG